LIALGKAKRDRVSPSLELTGISMARFLFTTWEGGGHVQPLLLVARDLRDRGHEVLILSDRATTSTPPRWTCLSAPGRPRRARPASAAKTTA
jgi:hypothetical protein